LKTARQVCQGICTLEPKEVENVLAPCHADAMVWTICALRVQARVGARTGLARWGEPGLWQPHGDCGVTRVGARAGPPLQKSQRVLNRARWSRLAVARVLRGLVVEPVVATGPVLMGSDATGERRRGAKIKAKGSYRASVRSARSPLVKARGLRWLGARV